MSLLTLLWARHDYTAAITRTQSDPSTLQIDQDILVNNKRVGGVQIAVTFLKPNVQKTPDFVVTPSVNPAALDQTIDLSYAGVAFCRLMINAQPDPGIGYALSVATRALDVPQPALVMSTNTVP